MKRSQKKLLIKVSISLAIILVIIGVIFLFKNPVSETYVGTTASGEKIAYTIFKGEPSLAEQAVTFTKTEAYPGDSVLLKDVYKVPNIGTACIYKANINLYGPSGNVQWYKDINCLATGPYTSGSTITNSISFSIPNKDSSVGEWTATSTYFKSNDGCNACPTVGQQVTEQSTNSLNVIKKVVTCNPNWDTSDWGECIAGTQTRDVNDANDCGTTSGKPKTSQSCTVDEIDDGSTTETCETNPSMTGCEVVIENKYYIVSSYGNNCIEVNEKPLTGEVVYSTLADCNNRVNSVEDDEIDYTLYIFAAVITILLITAIILVIKKYRR